MNKIIKRMLILFATVVVLGILYVLVFFPPVMAGMDAKIMCSCVFLTGRTPESVMEKELKVFPGLTSARFTIDKEDSTVTARILWKTSKAIYRKGLGCTLLAERSEDEVRSQRIILPSPPTLDQELLRWPTGNLVDPEQIPEVDYETLQKSVNRAFEDIDEKKPTHTHAVVVLYEGQLINEKYAPGFDHHSKMMGWSMTKSIVNALVGILVNEGKLMLDEPAPVPEWTDDRQRITLNHLLQASSGLTWQESYFVPTSDFHNMFTKSDDKGGFAASRKLKREPGSYFEYSSGTTNILARMIRQQVGDDAYYKFPYEKLFYKIGMNNTVIEPDASGTFVGSSYGFGSARDWARFGLLYLNDGVWEGERILPKGWVAYSTTPAPAAPLQEYGAQIWLNAGKKGDAKAVRYPGLPNDAFIFDGFEENSVVVIPSRKIVIVRLGVTHHNNFDLAGLVAGVLSALPQPQEAVTVSSLP